MNTKFILRQICINLNEAKRQWKAGWGEPEFGESEAYALTFLIQTHVRAHTLSPSLHTHSSESPASLPSLVSLGKKSLKKKSVRCSDGSDSPRLPFLLLSTISPLQHSSFLPLPLRRSQTSYPDTRTFKWKPFYFPVPSPPPSWSSHFTPLFLFSAFLPCCLP